MSKSFQTPSSPCKFHFNLQQNSRLIFSFASDRTQAAAFWREAVPVRQVLEEVLALRLVLAAHEPQIQLLQAVQRLVDDATLAEAPRRTQVQQHFATVLSHKRHVEDKFPLHDLNLRTFAKAIFD